MAFNTDLAKTLCRLGAKTILVELALEDRMPKLRCMMPKCQCPLGRFYFETCGDQSYWAPSADRFPVLGRDGGEYTLDNVRLAHFQCNRADGGWRKVNAWHPGLAVRAGVLGADAMRVKMRDAPSQAYRDAQSAKGRIGGRRGMKTLRERMTVEQQLAHNTRARKIGLCVRWWVNRDRGCAPWCGHHVSSLP